MNSDGGVVPQDVESAARPVTPEKMVPQSEVDKAIYATKMREKEKAEAQYKQELERERAKMGGMTQDSANSQSPLDMDEVVRRATETMEQRHRENEERKAFEEQKRQLDNVARNYYAKMEQGKNLYDDFDTITSDYNPGAFDAVTILATEMENTPDIIYELMKNPLKLAQLHTLAKTNWTLANKEMEKLSKSIKRNDDALASNQKSPAPLSRLKTSAVAGQDSGKRRISDLRKMDYLKV